MKFYSKADKALEKIKNLKNINIYPLKTDSIPNNPQISKNNFFDLNNNIDNSNFKLNIPHKNFFPHTTKNDENNLFKKKPIKENYSIAINNKLSLTKPKNFRFPYHLYLLNIFNKYFSPKRMYCVNKKFIDVWKYMINLIDVSKYFEILTNVDLINKILFELKNDDGKVVIKRF